MGWVTEGSDDENGPKRRVICIVWALGWYTSIIYLFNKWLVLQPASQPRTGVGSRGFSKTQGKTREKPTPVTAGVGFHGYGCGFPRKTPGFPGPRRIPYSSVPGFTCGLFHTVAIITQGLRFLVALSGLVIQKSWNSCHLAFSIQRPHSQYQLSQGVKMRHKQAVNGLWMRH